MKLFEAIKSIFRSIGIQPLEQNHKYPINWRNVLFVLIQCNTTIATIAFLLFDAKTFNEQTESFFSAITTAGNLFLITMYTDLENGPYFPTYHW